MIIFLLVLVCILCVMTAILFALWREEVDRRMFWTNTCLWERNFISCSIKEGKDITLDGVVYVANPKKSIKRCKP